MKRVPIGWGRAALVTTAAAVLAASLTAATPAPARTMHAEDESGFLPTQVEFYPAIDPPWRPHPQDYLRIDRGSRLGLGYGLYLNRVDGFSLLLSQEIENQGWAPSLRFYQGYGVQSDEWSGAGEVRIHPFHENLSLGARWAAETHTWLQPTQPISATENLVAAFVSRDDFYDYFRREGSSYYAQWSPFADGGWQVAYFDEDHESRRRRAGRVGIFGGDEPFDSNPSVDAGSWTYVRSRFFWRKADERTVWGPHGGVSFAIDAQWSGGELGGERWFTRIWAEHRGQLRLTPAQGLSYRLAAGGTPQGVSGEDGSRLPRQWRFQAGGVGSLRGHEFQAFQGDRVLLGTLEYGFDLGANVVPVLFVDGGKAWNESDDATSGIAGSGPLALDGGIGLMLGADALRVDVARDLRAERATARVTIRLANTF